jgi:hypothetical protein
MTDSSISRQFRRVSIWAVYIRRNQVRFALISHRLLGPVSDDQTRFDPTDPLIEQGIGWRLHTLDLRPALPISTISTSNTQYLADVEIVVA